MGRRDDSTRRKAKAWADHRRAAARSRVERARERGAARRRVWARRLEQNRAAVNRSVARAGKLAHRARGRADGQRKRAKRRRRNVRG